MSNNNKYYSIMNRSTSGESFISSRVFEKIVENILIKSKDARLAIDKKNKNVNDSIKCEIGKDNLVYLSVDIAIKKGKNIKKICDELLDEIKSSILFMSETKANVKLNVAQIDY